MLLPQEVSILQPNECPTLPTEVVLSHQGNRGGDEGTGLLRGQHIVCRIAACLCLDGGVS